MTAEVLQQEKKARGGQIKPPEVKQKRRQISLDDASVAAAKRIGDGNISEGIRIALSAMEKKGIEYDALSAAHRSLIKSIELILNGTIPPTMLQLESALLLAQRAHAR